MYVINKHSAIPLLSAEAYSSYSVERHAKCDKCFLFYGSPFVIAEILVHRSGTVVS